MREMAGPKGRRLLTGVNGSKTNAMAERTKTLDGNAERIARRPINTWNQVNWANVDMEVRRMQERIFRAAKNSEHAKVKNLQKLMMRSFHVKAAAVRQVTQLNSGKHTAGVDGYVCSTDAERMDLLKNGLSFDGYRASPVRRVYIPKSNGKLRPLGIPTVKDRVMQAIVKFALEPEWESRFEANSYGFRRGRSAHDAVKAIWLAANKTGASQWVLDADISACFDMIDHDALIALLPEHFHDIVLRWLKAGVVELGTRKDSEAGTPQGGIISPLLANIALNGMERLFGAEYPSGKPKPPRKRSGPNHGVNLIRYADDFVVFCPSQEVAEQYVLPKLGEFLAKRGLELSEAKTKLVHISEGFNFLGFNIRTMSGKVLVKPQKEKVLDHLRQISTYLRSNRQLRTVSMVTNLNLVIRGWSLYYRYVVAKRTFATVDNALWPMIYKWAKRRHPQKPHKWVARHYFKNGVGSRQWQLNDGKRGLLKHDFFKILRWVKVKGRASPFDPDLRIYWELRRKEKHLRSRITA